MKNYLILIAGIICLLAACNGDDGEPVSIGGKGGNAVLNVTPRHHGRAIDSCMIYIKYNATDPPSGGHYDDSAKCVPVVGITNHVATFSGLKKGNYYIYGYGWDPTLTPPQAVKGGFAYPISNENTQSLDLAVSED